MNLAVSALLRRSILVLLAHAGMFCVSDVQSAHAQGRGSRSAEQLSRAIDAIISDEAFDNAFWGIQLVDLESGEVLYERNAGKSFVPASNAKLYTTAAALDLLGPDYRYRTNVYVDGPVVEGTLHGNVIVRGSGDPTIGGRFHEEDRTRVFQMWVDSLQAMGITRVEGDLIGDDDIFDDVPYGRGWSWDDLEYYYAVEIGGLSYNENAVDFSIRGQREGMPGAVSWEPFNTDYVEVINSTTTLEAGRSIKEGYEREPGSNVIELSSLVPAGKIDNESLSIYNPTLFFTHVFRESLLRNGISVSGYAVDVDDLPIKPDYADGTLRRVASYTSPPLPDIVTEINRESNNFVAEQVLKTIGAEWPTGRANVELGSARAGEIAMRQMLGEIGIDTTDVQLVDGSGLSRMNLITPEATVQLLRYMWNHGDPEAKRAFYTSLPTGGDEGTLEFRFTSGPAHRNVRAKTGTISNTSSLSGYVYTAARTPVAFSIVVNHYTTRTANVRQAQDRIVELIARHPR